MSFLFKACFEPQIEASHYFEKEYDPKVDLLPRDKQGREVKPAKKPSTIANKLRSRGGFNKPHLQKDYDELTIEAEDYQKFLGKKRSDRSMWGVTFEEYQQQVR